MTPGERYRRAVARGELSDDPAQRRACAELDALHRALVAAGPPQRARGLLARLRARRREPVPGLYLWGGVGRGKTFLVDAFHDGLPFEDKLRIHFHRFMGTVHEGLRRRRERRDPLRDVAAELAGRARVLCLDEFFVSDITDAMILSGLLHALIDEGVTLVATSNAPPDELYRDGLQRARFIPAIELLKTRLRVVELDGETDYRLRFLESAEIYHTPLDEAADTVLADDFEHVAPDPGVDGAELEIAGRRLPTRRLADGVVWLDFAVLCEGPRSQYDYVELARLFHTVVLSGVPVLDAAREDAARRFISLVDEFYDRGVKLIVSAADAPEALYRGERLAFEFERTASRLREMQSREYLASPHRP